MIHELSGFSINTCDEFLKLVPQELHTEGISEPSLMITCGVRDRSGQQLTRSGELKIHHSDNLEKTTLLDIEQIFQRLKPFDIVEVLLKIKWEDNALEMIQDKQDEKWCELSRLDEAEYQGFLLQTKLFLSNANPLDIFKYRTKRWNDIPHEYMTPEQTCGVDDTHYVLKSGFLDVKTKWYVYGGFFISMFLGWYFCTIFLLGHTKIRQTYSIWLSSVSGFNENKLGQGIAVNHSDYIAGPAVVANSFVNPEPEGPSGTGIFSVPSAPEFS